VNEAWFRVDTDKPGLYRGQCAELCGRDHGFMPIVVDVRSKADFAAWLKEKAAEQKQAAAAPAPAPSPAAAPAVSPPNPGAAPAAPGGSAAPAVVASAAPATAS
jgi:cytochrome c oxidase subunit 2